MKKIHFTLPLLILAACMGLSVSTRAGDQFTFAGVTFNQTNAPNKALLLGEGVNLGGAVFSSGIPTQATTSSGLPFPTATPAADGFNTGLSLGNLSGVVSSSVTRGLNLPGGNNGNTTRHGAHLSFTNGFGIPNGTGADLVIFESASSQAAVEGMIVRVLTNRFTSSWTKWYYVAATGYENGVHAYVYDFSNMGVAANVIVEEIQVANLFGADRINATGTDIGGGVFVGEGEVDFTSTSTVLPDAGTFDPDRIYTTPSSDLDPDPILVCGLHNLVPFAPDFTDGGFNSGNVDLVVKVPPQVSWTLQSTDSLNPVSWQDVLNFTNTGDGTGTVTDSGQNSRPAPNTVPMRFYRIISTPLD